jgi:transcriptional regulator with XRE-family HTH domain
MTEKEILVERVNKVIGILIEQERATRRMSQIQVASRSGLSRTYLSDIERGLRNLSVISLCKIATALDMRASDFLLRAEVHLSEESTSSSMRT